jgi:dihydrofolate synthase / folylpolyglutamate synthase
VTWDLGRAEEHLLSLELFGMRFGLERMRRLLTALGSPQERFGAIHVVGTNGKSSTVRMTAALLEAHGTRTGAYLSPHLTSFAERIRVGDEDLSPDAFGAAIERAAAAAAKVDRTLSGGERVTQFELLTAAGFDELARREVEVAVVEAGLGGRWDATNVLGAPVVVLTNVGLEHTRWLGPTIRDIAGEKLAVVRPGATLVLGADQPEVVELAEATGATIVHPEAGDVGLPGYQRLNFAAAIAAAAAYLATRGSDPRSAQSPRPGTTRGLTPSLDPARASLDPAGAAPDPARASLDPARVQQVAARMQVPGRLQVIAESPRTVLDGAHNPSGIEALAAALPDERPLVAVVGILDDKDASSMLKALVPHVSSFVFTASSNRRSLPPATLASLAAQLGAPASEVEPDARAALARARVLAGPGGAVVATGSIYLVADLASPPGARRASAL